LQSSPYEMERPHLNLVASVDSGRWGLALTFVSLKSRIERCLCEKGLMPAKPSRAGSTAGGPVNRYWKPARWNRAVIDAG